jgi:putative (di)nucleoside polyphosphate hydrolase
VEVLGCTRGWLRYRLPRQYVRDRCIGQKQRWYLLRLTAEESKLRFDHTATPEFDRWRWADYWTPVREVVYFKRRVYMRALHDLGQASCFPTGCRRIPSGGRRRRLDAVLRVRERQQCPRCLPPRRAQDRIVKFKTA